MKAALVLWLTSVPLLILASGCAPKTAPVATPEAASEADAHAGHDHGHDDVGPHGGHLLHLEPTGSHAEWTHDDENHLITVHLDDFDATKVVSAKFTAKVGDSTEEFPLTASDDGWTITSEELMTHINMKDAAEVNLVVVDDQGVHSSKIEAHEHHHH